MSGTTTTALAIFDFRGWGSFMEGAVVIEGIAVTVGSDEKISLGAIVFNGGFGLASATALAAFAFSNADSCLLEVGVVFFNFASGLADRRGFRSWREFLIVEIDVRSSVSVRNLTAVFVFGEND